MKDKSAMTEGAKGGDARIAALADLHEMLGDPLSVETAAILRAVLEARKLVHALNERAAILVTNEVLPNRCNPMRAGDIRRVSIELAAIVGDSALLDGGARDERNERE